MDDLDHSMRISDYDWLSFFEESEEGCLLKASLACLDSTDLSDGDDADFTDHTYISFNTQQAREEDPHVLKDVSSVLCFAEEASNALTVSGDAKPKPRLRRSRLNCSEKLRWFVMINDSQRQFRRPASGAVVKKKRNQKKIWKDKHKDGKGLTTCNTDMIMQIRGPEELFCDANKKCLENMCKGERSHHLDIEKNKNQIKSGCSVGDALSPCNNTNQELSSIRHSKEQSKDLASPGAYYEGDELHFAIKNRKEPTSVSDCDVGFDKLKCIEASATLFFREKDSDLEQESSLSKLKLDLTCIRDSKLEVNLDTCKSTKGCLDLAETNQADYENSKKDNRGQKKLKELNVDIKCLGENIMYQSAVDIIRSNDFAPNHQNFRDKNISNEKSKHSLKYSGVSCKEACSYLARETVAEPIVETGKPTRNSDSHTNSVELDEFSEVEFFSTSSNDSETYHSASEAYEDQLHLPIQNTPCHLPLKCSDDSLADRGMDSGLQRKDRQAHIETSQIFPSAHLSADKTPNENSECNEDTKGTALSMAVDTHTSAGNSSSSLAPGSLLPFDVAMQSPEAYAKATGNNQPVYAISAFWDEMEKLTINDILHIRTGRCMLPVEESTNELLSTTCTVEIPPSIMPERAILDSKNLVNSDHYTNLNESIPDHSSCNFSTSDFEEEYWQFINSSRNSTPDLQDQSYNNQSCVVTGDEDSDEMGTLVPAENALGQKWSCESTFCSYDVTVPHLKKTKSMYDVHALKSIENSYSFFDQSSCKFPEESFNIINGFEVVTPIMCHTEEQCQISFPKVFDYIFDDNKEKFEALFVSVYGLPRSSTLSKPPINNYTFCTINDLPLKNFTFETVPIFSCTRSIVREKTFQKQDGIFLGANYMALKEVSPIQIISQSIIKSLHCNQTDRAFCFSQDLSSLYSLKNVCFLDKEADLWKHACEDKKKPKDAFDSSFTVVGNEGLFPMTPMMFKEKALRQISMEHNQIPSDYRGIFSTLKQSDMCLVCIAFASWVLRSSDPESADAWKAALLANVSALSAIQYLRQFMKRKAAPQDD